MNTPTIIAYDIEFPTSYSRRISFFKNLTPSIFLAGPTNRNGRTQGRTDIIKLFSEREFAGSLFVPEFMDASKNIRSVIQTSIQTKV